MRRGAAGFTILELLAVVAVMGILAALAIPGFGYLAASTKVKGASTELYLAMIRARSESVKRNRGVRVIATSGDETNWHDGWRVIADGNNDGDYIDVPEDRVVYQQGALKSVTISMAAFEVQFRPNGRISSPAVVEFSVSAEDRDRRAELVRCVVTDLTGRAYVKQEAC